MRNKKYIIFVFVFSFVMLTITACSKKVETKQYTEEAISCLDNMEYKQAEVLLKQALSLDSNNTNIYKILAETYQGMFDYEEALHILKVGVEETGDEELEDLIQSITEQKNKWESVNAAWANSLDEKNFKDYQFLENALFNMHLFNNFSGEFTKYIDFRVEAEDFDYILDKNEAEELMVDQEYKVIDDIDTIMSLDRMYDENDKMFLWKLSLSNKYDNIQTYLGLNDGGHAHVCGKIYYLSQNDTGYFLVLSIWEEGSGIDPLITQQINIIPESGNENAPIKIEYLTYPKSGAYEYVVDYTPIQAENAITRINGSTFSASFNYDPGFMFVTRDEAVDYINSKLDIYGLNSLLSNEGMEDILNNSELLYGWETYLEQEDENSGDFSLEVSFYK